MHTFATVGITVILCFASAPPAFAQRIPFERSFELNTPAAVDVSTLRGKIEIGVCVAGRVIVRGEVTGPCRLGRARRCRRRRFPNRRFRPIPVVGFPLNSN